MTRPTIGCNYDSANRRKIEGDAFHLQGVLIETEQMNHAERMDRFIFRTCVIIGAMLFGAWLFA